MFPDLTQFLWIAWLCLAIVFIVIELITLEFTFAMLAAGTLIGGVGSSLLGWPWWVQFLLAAALSALLLFTIRPLLLKVLRRGGDPAKSNIDAVPDTGGRVEGPFAEGLGRVKLDNGETWTARLSAPHAGAILAEGDRVVVTRVMGWCWP